MGPETSFLTPRMVIGHSEREGGGRRRKEGVVKGKCEATCNKTGNSMMGWGRYKKKNGATQYKPSICTSILAKKI